MHRAAVHFQACFHRVTQAFTENLPQTSDNHNEESGAQQYARGSQPWDAYARQTMKTSLPEPGRVSRGIEIDMSFPSSGTLRTNRHTEDDMIFLRKNAGPCCKFYPGGVKAPYATLSLSSLVVVGMARNTYCQCKTARQRIPVLVGSA